MVSLSSLGILRNILLPTTHFSLIRKDSSLNITVPMFRVSLCSLDTISRERPLLGDRNCDVMTVAIPSDHKLFLYITDTKRILNMICGRQVRTCVRFSDRLVHVLQRRPGLAFVLRLSLYKNCC